MAKKFNYDKMIKDMSGWALDYGDEAESIAQDGAYEAAADMIRDNPEIAKYLKSLGVTDCQGRLADDIHSVALKEI